MSKDRNPLKTAVWIIIFLAAAAAVFSVVRHKPEKKDTATIMVPVERGPLVINLIESGSIKPREQIKIKSEVEGRPTILYLIPEGTRVKKGQLLVELDTSSLMDNRVNQDIVVQNANSTYVNALENLEVVKNQAQADIELAELNLRFAEEDLIKYEEGEYPNKLNSALGRVTLAEEELERSRDKLEWSRKLYDEKYLSETELKGDELAYKNAELSEKTAKGDLSLLERYTYKRDVEKLKSDVSQNKLTLERTKRKSNANVVQAEATLRARELEYNRQKERLEKYDSQIEKARILAPEDGLAIYATSARGWEPLAEGSEVHERQELIYLPTADTFLAEVDIHESNLKKVYPGLPARIKVDAIPGVTFMGKVEKISPLPDPHRMWQNPDLKVYKTQIFIDGGGDLLKSGMNCQAEIIIEQYEDTLYLPVQSVVRVDKAPSVWMVAEKGTEARPVTIGLDNNRFVRIIDGVSEGDEVMLSPPLGSSISTVSTEIIDGVEIPTREEAEKKADEARQERESDKGRQQAGGESRKPGERRIPPGAVTAPKSETAPIASNS